MEGVSWHRTWHSYASRRSGISSLAEILSAPPRPSPACLSLFNIEQLSFPLPIHYPRQHASAWAVLLQLP